MNYSRQPAYQDGREGAGLGHQQPGQSGLSHAPSPVNNHLVQPHLKQGPLDLGFLPNASSSQTSLLEAVVGTNAPLPQSTPSTQTNPPSSNPGVQRSKSNTENSQRGGISREANREPSFGTSTEKEWDVLSDASLRLNERDPDQAVEELQQKVNKRRSNLPHLESQLAELEAQIKAAEERIAKAQSGTKGSATGQPA